MATASSYPYASNRPLAAPKFLIRASTTNHDDLSTDPTISAGSAAPTAVAPQGSLYLRTGGADFSTVLYINVDGDTDWRSLDDGTTLSTGSLTLNGDAELVYERLVYPVISVGDVTGGDTAGVVDLDLQTVDETNIASAKCVTIYASTSAGSGDRALSSTVTFSSATNGSIVATGNGWATVLTDATGNFTSTVSNSADETVYFSVVSAVGGVAAAGQGCVVVESVRDSATWSA